MTPPLPPVPDSPQSTEVKALAARDDALHEQVTKLQADVTALSARVKKLEDAAGSSPTPQAAVVITITAAQQEIVKAMSPGQAAVLRGPTEDFVLIVV